MGTQIDDLVAMRDMETLYELMTEDDDWMTQLDAAEGLIKLGDRRGFEFIMTATLSDDDAILEVAQEILETPEMQRMRREVESERENEHRARLETARKRLASGGKVYRYKMAHLPSNALMGDDPFSKGYEVPALDNIGLDGWEVVHVLPIRRAIATGGENELFTGVYCLLKKEILSGESIDLEG